MSTAPARAADERGSLPVVILVMMIGLAMTAVTLPMLLTQIRTTTFGVSRQNSLDAAQSGIDVVLGRIRDATNASGSGNPSKLPCYTKTATANTGPATGTVGAPSTESYKAWVDYYVVDPLSPGATPMTCVPGSGPYTTNSSGTTVFVPYYARIWATGVDGTAGSGGRSFGRAISTTYVFKTTNKNVAGGQIHVNPYGNTSAAKSLCLDAGSTRPQAGDVLTAQVCSTSNPPAEQQLFSYRSDLTIQVVPTSTPDYTNGLCLAPQDASAKTSQGGTPAKGLKVVLAPCSALGSPPYQQQWSYDDGGRYQASNSDSAQNGNLPDLVMHLDPDSLAAGSVVDIQSGSASNTTWYPDFTVGAGGAAYPQTANFGQFGRCLDVDQFDLRDYWDHMLVYPCKQNPYQPAVRWNQRIYWDAANGWLYVLPDNSTTKYCLMSPWSEGAFVAVTKCASPGATASTIDSSGDGTGSDVVPNATAAKLVWKMYDGSTDLPYKQRYTFVDSGSDKQRCLSLGPADGSTSRSGASTRWSWATVATCDGTAAQKWNATADVASPALQDSVEVTATGN